MRSLLALMAIFMFVATIGCNNGTEEKKEGGDKPASTETEKKEEGDKDESASTGDVTPAMQDVSLNLPNVS